MEYISQKTVLITGGTKGIGLGIARALLQEKMKVAITGRSDKSVELAFKQLQNEFPDQVMGMVADVRNMEEQSVVVEQLLKHWGRLDVLIANAGVGHFEDIQSMTQEQWTETIEINLTGVFNTIKSGLQALITSKGYFITIASLAGTNFFAKGAAYNASKFGLVGFTQAVMLDLRKHGIKTTTIMPGSVSTHFNNHIPGDKDAWKIQPEDIGQMVVDLLKMHPRTLPSKIEVRPTMPA